MSCIMCSISFAQDWLSIIDTVITLLGWGITLYIASTISRKIDSERTLKNHFIEEVKSIRDNEESIFNYVIENQIRPQQLKNLTGNLNTRVGDLMNLLMTQYGISEDFLNAFQWKYSQLFSDDEDYTSNFKEDKVFNFNHQLLKDFSNYRMDKLKLFNDLIVLINNAKSKSIKKKK